MMSFLDLNGDDFGITSLIFPPIHSLQCLNPWMLDKMTWSTMEEKLLGFQIFSFCNSTTLRISRGQSQISIMPNPLAWVTHANATSFPQKHIFCMILYHVLLFFILTIVPLSGPFCVIRYHWKVESHDDIIESSTIPNPNGVTEATKKSQEAFTERGGHTQTIQMIPEFPSLNDPIHQMSIHPNPNFLSEDSEDSCWCHPQTATNKLLAECSKWFDIKFTVISCEALMISRHCLCRINYMPSWCYT